MANYSVDDIKALKTHEHIRLRPGMYIGYTNFKGYVYLIRECINSACSVYGFETVKLRFCENGVSTIQLSDATNGPVHSAWSKMYVPGNGIGIFWGVLIALSKSASVTYQNAQTKTIEKFEKGESTDDYERLSIEDTEVFVEFEFDPEIWDDNFKWNYQFLVSEIKSYAYLNSKVSIALSYEVEGNVCNEYYHFGNGLKDLLAVEKLKYLGNCIFEFSTEKQFKDFKLNMTMAYCYYTFESNYIRSFVNHTETPDHGTHLEGVLKGLKKGIKKYVNDFLHEDNYTITRKKVKQYLIACIHVVMDHPHFMGSTKAKLGNKFVEREIAAFVKNEIYGLMSSDEELAQKLLMKFAA